MALDDGFAGGFCHCQFCGMSQIVPGLGIVEEADAGKANAIYVETSSKQAALDLLVGQDSLKKELRYQIAHAKSRKEPVQHILLCGPQGRGKTAFAQAIAADSGVQLHLTSGRSLNRGSDLVGILTKLAAGDVLAVQDIEAVPEITSEYLVKALNDFAVDITLDSGMHARSITMPLPPFTLIGTSSKPSRVNEELSKWMISYDLMPYTDDEIRKLISRFAVNQGFTLASGVAELLAQFSESSPHSASVMLKRIKDQGFVIQGCLSVDAASDSLRHLGYRRIGPNSHDLIKALRTMPGIEFERFVADVFQRNGYTAELTAATGDHGIDIILRKLGRVIVVQCKQWDGTVGEPVLREFYGSLVAVRADGGFVVTTSSFTSQAEEFARDKPIELYDIDALIRLCLDGGTGIGRSSENGLFGRIK